MLVLQPVASESNEGKLLFVPEEVIIAELLDASTPKEEKT